MKTIAAAIALGLMAFAGNAQAQYFYSPLEAAKDDAMYSDLTALRAQAEQARTQMERSR